MWILAGNRRLIFPLICQLERHPKHRPWRGEDCSGDLLQAQLLEGGLRGFNWKTSSRLKNNPHVRLVKLHTLKKKRCPCVG
jgi:hypothetical protein